MERFLQGLRSLPSLGLRRTTYRTGWALTLKLEAPEAGIVLVMLLFGAIQR
jgi:hypothetical protein